MIHAARDYLWTPLLADDADALAGNVDGRGYGSVAMDMFAPSRWAPVETVRARSWHDVHLGEDPQALPATSPRNR
jgi:hypothetical protein